MQLRRKMHSQHPKCRSIKKHFPKSKLGFSLVEMLVVLAIIAFLAVAIIPSIFQVMAASLTQAGFSLSSTITSARQAALAQNQSMEIRLYQYADPTVSGEIAANPTTGKYRAFQVFQIADSGTVTAFTMVQTLPAGIIIDSGAQLSSIIGPGQSKIWTATDPQISLPVIGVNYNCMAFRMRPDGSTNLASILPSPPGSWCLTLHSNNLGDGLSTPPANFITVQVDPVSGKMTVFHP